MTSEPGRLADLALALAASAPAGQAAPWIIRANNRAGDFDDADRARLVIARALVGVQYGEADEVERALSDYARTEGPPRRRGRSVRAHPSRAHPAVARRSQRRTRDMRAHLGSARRTKPAAGRTDRRARLGCVRRRSAHRGRAPRGTSAHGCRICRTSRPYRDGRRGSHAGPSGVRARRSRHGRTRARAVALDERGPASRLRAREPAVALESLARRRPSRRGTLGRRASASVPATRLHQSAPQPLSRTGRPHRNRDRRPRPRHPMRAEPPAGKPSIPAPGSDRARPKRPRSRRRRPRSMHAGNDARAPRRRAAFRPGRARPEI